MNAVLLTGHGDLDKLEYRENVSVPRPAANDVLVEVRACGLNNTDIWTRKAAYGDDSEGWKGQLDFRHCLVEGA